MKYPEYDSPFLVVTQQTVDKAAQQFAQQFDEMCHTALMKCAVNVDEETLLAVLKQDAQRYRDAYSRGYETAESRSAKPVESEIAGVLECGACGASVKREEGYRFRHCPWCGVKIDWENIDD